MYSFGQKILDIVVEEYGITLPNIDSCLSYPPKPDLGDFAFSCFTIAKEIKANPNEIATRLATLFNNVKNTFASASSMGGYVNFHLNSSIFIEDLYKINLNQKPNNNETIIVDYIGANVGKPLHIGHLCTPSLGQTIINTYKYLGYKVISDSHFGDWGGIFGKLITGMKVGYRNNNLLLEDAEIYDRINEILENELPDIDDENINLAFQRFNNLKRAYGDIDINIDGDKYMDMLHDLYVVMTYAGENNIFINEQFGIEFKKLSRGDKFNIYEWQKLTATSIIAVKSSLEKFLEIRKKDEKNLEILDFDIGESFYEGINLPKLQNYPDLKFNMKDVVIELLEAGIATQNEDGSVGVVFPEEAKMPSCVLQKKDGTGLYLTSDLAAIKYRLTNGWNPDKIVYFVDVRQQLHLKQAFWIAKKAWGENTELYHAYNGFIKLKDGAMSSRKGRIIKLKDLIDEGIKRTKELFGTKGKDWSIYESSMKIVAIGAIKYSYLSQDREKDIVFDWDKALSFEGNSGPYIQYAYVRASKIVRHAVPSAGSASIDPESSSGGRFAGTELSQYDKSLIKKLNEFEGKVQETANKYKPHIIAQYCYELASEFNSFYVNTPRILEEQDENLRSIRLTIISKIKEVLHKGFELLAIDMPDEM